MSTHQDPLVDAITLGVPTLLQLLDGLTAVLERFNPDQREQLLAILQPEQAKLNTIQQTLETAAFPDKNFCVRLGVSGFLMLVEFIAEQTGRTKLASESSRGVSSEQNIFDAP